MKLPTLLFPLILCSPCLAQPSPLDSVTSYAFQLQNLSLSEIAAAPYELVVMDYSADGSDEQRYTAEQLNSIRSTSRTPKLLIAYLSIGEAEDYRFYFRKSWIRRDRSKPCGKARTDSAPEWLDRSNRNWCGNYKVRYWQRAWQKIIFGRQTGRRKSYLDRIIDAGFDGIYLDIIDGFEYWKNKRPRSERRDRAPTDMAQFVISLATYARETRGRPNFVVIPQNGSGILDEISPNLKSRYLSAIDAIGAEDTFFFGDRAENNSLNPQELTITYLDQFRAAGKPVFATDYLTDPEKIAVFKTLACERGYIPQVSTRNLDSLAAHKLVGCSNL